MLLGEVGRSEAGTDTPAAPPDFLPELVVYFRENGYEFRALYTGGEDRAILASCGARMMLPETAGE